MFPSSGDNFRFINEKENMRDFNQSSSTLIHFQAVVSTQTQQANNILNHQPLKGQHKIQVEEEGEELKNEEMVEEQPQVFAEIEETAAVTGFVLHPPPPAPSVEQ